MVSSMAAYTDVGRAHEVANDVRRLHKQLLEAQQNALLYNNRERLFDMPVTNVSYPYLFFLLKLAENGLLLQPLF